MEKNPDIKLCTTEEISSLKPTEVININQGVLGHIDSGKTSLCRALTNIQSTASFDKNPQAQAQGITNDLGFSAFFTHVPDMSNIVVNSKSKQYLQYTLVDCPGHASQIKTIIAGANVIDMMVLVIDITKGIQIQTAECIVLGELLGPKQIVALNKVDMIEESKRETTVKKKIEAFKKLFSKTKFAERQKEIKFVTCSAISALEKGDYTSIENLKKQIVQESEYNECKSDDYASQDFSILIDHCFAIKGKGTVATGTITSGVVKTGDEIELPEIGEIKKIKSIQMFRKNIDKVMKGDRCGQLIPNLDPTKIERSIICKPNSLKPSNLILGHIKGVRYHKFPIKSKSKIHQSIGNRTIMAKIFLFRTVSDNLKYGPESTVSNFDKNKAIISVLLDEKTQNEYVDEVDPQNAKDFQDLFVIMHLEKDVFIKDNSQYIGAKFDLSTDIKECRLAFSGNVIFKARVENEKTIESLLPIKISRLKEKKGTVEKLQDDRTLLIKNMFKKETNLTFFMNKEIFIKELDIKGVINSSFGKTGKVKVALRDSIDKADFEKITANDFKVCLNYKKFIKIK